MKPVIAESKRLDNAMTRALWALVEEMRAAREKHGKFAADPAVRVAVFGEEVHEVYDALCTGKPQGELRKELLQVAAVCVRWAVELEE